MFNIYTHKHCFYFVSHSSQRPQDAEVERRTDSPGVVRTAEQAALSVDYNEDGLTIEAGG